MVRRTQHKNLTQLNGLPLVVMRVFAIFVGLSAVFALAVAQAPIREAWRTAARKACGGELDAIVSEESVSDSLLFLSSNF